jgi:hypothetical protein
VNNHNPHNHIEQRPDERPFAYILKRALLPQQDESIDTAQANVHHSGVPDHNRARINPDRAGMRCIGVASTLIARR